MGSLGYCHYKNPEKLQAKIKVLENSFKKQNDPLRLNVFESYYNKFKTGIGEKRRKFIYEAFTIYNELQYQISGIETVYKPQKIKLQLKIKKI